MDPAADLDAVALVLLRVSQLLVDFPEIVDLDINPLLADESSVIALDARINVVARQEPASKRLAIRPYPKELEELIPVGDGREVLLRPIVPEDEPSLQTAFTKLTAEEVRLRFFAPKKTLSHFAAVRFTQIDYRREMALVAIVEQASGPIQVGVARYFINPDKSGCEFAIVVSDRIQHQGIGTRLMKALMEAARDHGLTRIEGTVLRENASMLMLMKELGFAQSRSTEDPELVVVERWL